MFGRRGGVIAPTTRAQFDSSRPLVLMHIPKTAGTSLAAALIETLRPDTAIVGVFDRVLFGDYGEFDSLEEAIRRGVYLSADALPAADLVTGHIAYSSLRERFADAQFITVLREPFSRLLSHWLYWRGLPDEYLVQWGGWSERVRQARKPLAAFLRERSLACQLDNVVVRMLLWPHPLIPVDNFIDARHGHTLLTDARDRLTTFAFVHLVENAGLSDVLQTWLDNPCMLDRRNETVCIPEPLRSPLANELTPEALDLLTMRSWLDLELWYEVARRSLLGHSPDQVRERTVMRNVARYGALMAA
jgi:hypothetical protein